MSTLLTALPQAAVKYSYMHSDTDAFRRLYEKVYGLAQGAMDGVDLSQFGVNDPQYALGPEALAIPSGVVMWDVLTIISGLFWTLVYIILIYKGFKDKTCGMPLFVLGLNWAFLEMDELVYTGKAGIGSGDFYHLLVNVIALDFGLDA